ncbi:hypothetical protein H6A35_09430 [Collinsella tanakaei]|nr:hypothetical protein [Collinsella tanakaei]
MAVYSGYVFAETRDIEVFETRLQASPSARAVLEKVDTLHVLNDREVRTLYELGGVGHIIRMSVGDIVSGRLVVRSGSLAGREDLIARVDRHRRSAWLRTGSPRSFGLRVGLEVVSKS